jgi:hypothetical protein
LPDFARVSGLLIAAPTPLFAITGRAAMTVVADIRAKQAAAARRAAQRPQTPRFDPAAASRRSLL